MYRNGLLIKKLLEMGELVFCGSASHSMTGRSSRSKNFDGVEAQEVLEFQRLKPLLGVKILHIVTGPVSCHSFCKF